MEHEPLTEDEKGLVACAIRYGGFPPKPLYLADCHRLMERGWFERRLVEGEITFWLSAEGELALELGVPLSDAKASSN
jgi:hypothetical protein